MNRHAAVLLAVLMLSFLGLADSWYLADSALSGNELTCSIAGLEGCNAVADSPYANLFGIPLALYGTAFYAILFTLAAIALLLPSRRLYGALLACGTLGVVASLYFLFVQIMFIGAICIYCLLSALITFVLFCLTLWLFRRRFLHVS